MDYACKINVEGRIEMEGWGDARCNNFGYHVYFSFSGNTKLLLDLIFKSNTNINNVFNYFLYFRQNTNYCYNFDACLEQKPNKEDKQEEKKQS